MCADNKFIFFPSKIMKMNIYKHLLFTGITDIFIMITLAENLMDIIYYMTTELLQGIL